uniref:Uncharacterized protein n=1 Tax=Leptocylindrus danicus TaxID=163516 RepID=A0A7S2K0Q4_9STRA
MISVTSRFCEAFQIYFRSNRARCCRPTPTLHSESSSDAVDCDGPKAAGRTRPERSSRTRRRSTTTTRNRESSKHQKEETVVFDGKALTSSQCSNEGASPFDLSGSNGITKQIRCMTPDISPQGERIEHPCFSFLSLDDLFGQELGMSAKFNDDASFRLALRAAIRQDIFDSTPFYRNLSEKAASVLLLPDSSLEGSWRKPVDYGSDIRMKHTTKVLVDAFDCIADRTNIPTGDELLDKIGSACGAKPSTHLIDIYGVQDRKISHSWHQDSGISPDSSKTVLWGFPAEDNYEGCGVFSHVIPLQYECVAPDTHPRMEPVLFDGFDENHDAHIVRPSYAPGRELLLYRDIDVLHSSPDVAYRTSVMRFM